MPELTTLKNGLRVISENSPHLESTAVGIWVDTGARNEPATLNGISHMLEHMAFKGTEKRSARAIAEEIESVGGHLNAYTSREQTAYYARVLKDDVPLALDIVSDILQHSTFEADELERERAVIVQEIGQAEDTPDDIVFDLFQETAYPDQPVGRPILGTEDLVRSFGRPELVGYMGTHYHAPNMVLAAAGRIDHAALVAEAELRFGALPGGTSHGPEAASYAGGDRREDKDLEQVHVVAGFPGIAYDDPDYYVSQVFSTVLGGGMSSRLFQEVREKRGLCYSVYSFASSLMDGGIFGIYAGTGESEVKELIPAMAGELVKLADPIPEAEVARARAQLKAGLLMSLESPSSRCEQFARQMLVFGRPLSSAEIIAKVEAVDAASLNRFATRLLAGTPTLTALGPIGQLEDYGAFAARFR